jgi:tetratricopeptide (TPR) repeat protein
LHDDDLDALILASVGGAAARLVDDLKASVVRPGQRLSHYRIVETIGEGGMGVVCKAVDEKLQRTVAIKILTSTGGDLALREQLEREARAASGLNHPSICTVHDFDEDAGHCFIVMECLEGETLKQRLARGPLAESDAIDIALAAASALEAAHAKSVLHCDIKPANIFLTAGGTVKVVDFGIARLQRDVGTEVRRASHDRYASGTRDYMSPEQARGEELDQRTDVFSLGVLLRGMVRAPGAALGRVIARMTQPDRGGRLRTMTEVLAALRAVRGARVRRVRMLAAAAVVLVAATAAAAAWRFRPRPPVLVERDWILIGDIANRTANPVFEDLLDDAVAVQMGQTPFLSVFGGARLQEQLKLMRQAPDARITPEIARDICARAGIKAFVTGSIAPLGGGYVLRLDAVDARTGDYIDREQTQIESDAKVLHAVGAAASAIRRRLGESYQSMQRFDTPLETATTSSLEALRAFQQGQDAMQRGTSAALKAIPFYRRAIDLDPDFALAWSRLSTAYESAREEQQAQEAAREAFSRLDRVSERERYQISMRYYGQVSGEISKAIEALELWTKAYPADAAAHNSLTAYLKDLGQLERAASSAETAAHLLPSSATYRANLAGAYVRLSRFDRAEDVCNAAIRDKIDNSTIHRFLYTIAFVRADGAAMAREEKWRASGTSDFANTEYQASLAGASGRVREARDLYQRAIALTERQGLADRAAQYRVRLGALLAAVGFDREAAEVARAVLAAKPARLVAADATDVLAASGDPDAAPALDRLTAEFPDDELLRNLWRPLVRSTLDVRAGRVAEAAETLRLLDAYDRGDDAALRPAYQLGLAELARGGQAAAAAAFRKVMDNRGVVATTPMFALAQLGAARAAATAAAYEPFLASWKDADADLPVLRQARAEYTRLGARSDHP